MLRDILKYTYYSSALYNIVGDFIHYPRIFTTAIYI